MCHHALVFLYHFYLLAQILIIGLGNLYAVGPPKHWAVESSESFREQDPF